MDVANSKYRGRHRTGRRSALTPRLLGAGLAVPTTATVVVAAMSSGGAGATVAIASHATTDSLDADRVELAGLKAGSVQALETGVADRAARGSERQRLDMLTAENARRAAAEAALSASDQVVEVKATNPAPVAAGATTAPKSVGSHAWVRPVDRYVLTCLYGYRWGVLHPADDLACPVGTPVKAMSSGVVILAGWSGGYGYKVEIRYWDGTVSWYAHNSRLKVKVGDTVAPGQVVALSGNTGHSTGPHVHLEIHLKGGAAINPLGWFRSKGIPL